MMPLGMGQLSVLPQNQLVARPQALLAHLSALDLFSFVPANGISAQPS